MKNLAKLFMGMVYAAIPIYGWFKLYDSFKRVKADEISIFHDAAGNAQIIEQGIYFSPFPGERFGKTYPKTQNYIDFGPIKRVRVNAGQIAFKTNAHGQLVRLHPGVNLINAAQNESFNKDTGIQSNQGDILDFGGIKIVRIREGFLGVKTNVQGVYETLRPGVHEIHTAQGETFDNQHGIARIDQDDYRLGNLHYVTIRNGELGESYKNGQFVLLEQGVHPLPPEHRFVKKVALNSDVVDLGAEKIVTVKEGQVATVNTPEGVKILQPGRHNVQQSEGNYFNEIISTCTQEIRVPGLTVMCSDQIEMRAESVMLYRVTEPLKTVGLGMEVIKNILKDIADGTLRTILSSFSSSDVAPSLHPDAEHHSSIRSEKLKELHDKCVTKLNGQAKDWGLEITDLQITEILPADEEYLTMLRNQASQQINADGARRIAENEATIAEIKAKAETSKCTAAKIAQEEAMIRAETAAKTKAVEAEANANQVVTAAKAKAQEISLIASAKADSVEKMNEAAKNAPKVVQKIMVLEAKAEILKWVKNPVFIQPSLGDTSIVTKQDNGVSFFSTKKEPSPLIDALALEQNGGRLLKAASGSSHL